jgi:hypothetical protein
MITASLATIPGRSVQKTIDSLKKQVDQLFVCYNQTDVSNVNFGDAAKFIPLQGLNGYLFTCDDDLIYPPDYIERMIEGIEKYDRKKIVTMHGRILPRRELKSYYKERLEGFRCLGLVENDVIVDSGGTGVMGWHSSLLTFDIKEFKAANMADIWVAKIAKEKGIKIVCLKHSDGWIRYVPPPDGTTIWEKKYNNDENETEIFNTFWP